MQFPYFLPLFMQIVLLSCTQVVTAISYLWDKENQIHGIQEVNYLTTTITVSLATYSMLVPLQVTTACLRKTDVSVEPIFDDSHFPDLEQTCLNKRYMYNTVVQRYIYIFFSSTKNNIMT